MQRPISVAHRVFRHLTILLFGFVGLLGVVTSTSAQNSPPQIIIQGGKTFTAGQMRNMKAALGVAALMTLAGCGIVAKVDARNDYQQSRAAYKECLADNQSNPAACEARRLAMEADERAYNNLAAGIQLGGSGSVNVNTQSR